MSIKNLYENLFNDFSGKSFKLNGELLKLSDFSHFAAMKGVKYDNQNIRLLVVGRAVNGWGQFSVNDRTSFGSDAENKFNNQNFDWVKVNEYGALWNENDYFLTKSPFWRTIQTVWEGLSEQKETRWIDYIAWTNIYKVAPSDTGNPTTSMCKCQLETCKKILDTEIKVFNPTHILFITGWEWWFDQIIDLFEKTEFIENNKRGNSIFVEGTAIYKYDNKSIPVVVSCRPEMRPEKEVSEQILKYFN